MSDQKPTLPDVPPFPSSGPRAFSHGRRQGPLEGSREALTNQTIEQALQDILDGLRLNNITGGVLELGTLRDVNQKFIADLDSALLTVKDDQTTPVDRVKLGKLGSGAQDYGLEIYDASGSQILSATGLGVDVVGTDQLQDSAVTEPKVATDAVSSTKIQDAAVIEAKINSAAVTASKIGSLAVTEAKVAASAITTAKIADLAVETGKLAASAVTTAKINDAAVEWAKIGDDAVRENNIIARGVAARHLFVGSFDNLVRNPGFEQGSLEEWSVAASGGGTWARNASVPRSGAGCLSFDPTGQTSDARFQNSEDSPGANKDGFAVSEGDQIYVSGWGRKTGAGLANRIQVSVLFRDEGGSALGGFTSSALTPTTSYQEMSLSATAPAGSAQAIFEAKVLNDGNSENVFFDDFYARRMVEGSIVVDGTITADHIAANTITASEIASGTITATEIAAGTITANEIDALTITSSEIAADAIISDKIASRAIATRHLFVGSFDNLVANPGFEESTTGHDRWTTAGGGGSWAPTTSNVRSGGVALAFDPSGQTGAAEIRQTEVIVSAPTDGSAVSEGDQVYAEVYVRKQGPGAANRARIDIRWSDRDGAFVAQSAATYVTPTTSYQKVSVTGTAPAGAAFMTVELVVANDGNSEILLFDDVYARRMVEGSIVVDGTITADHIAANTITASEIAAGTITTNELDANTLDAENINAGTLTAGVIIASSSFTAASPVFDGVVDVEGGDGGTRLRLYSSDGGHIVYYNTSAVQQAVMGYITTDDLWKLQSDAPVEIDTDHNIHLNMGVGGVLELSTALAVSAGSASSNWLELLINGTTYKVRLYADS